MNLRTRSELAMILLAVPAYADHGFAVFQLKPGDVTIHPMGLVFPTRAPDQLFFPTVHLHDGRFHATAKFDHALYFQHPRHTRQGARSGDDLTSFMRPANSYAELVDPGQLVVRRTLRARLPNTDTWIPAT